MKFLRSLQPYVFLSGIAMLIVTSCSKEHSPATDALAGKTDTTTFYKNPVKENVNYPYVTRINGKYYFLKSNGNAIWLTTMQEVQYVQYGYSKNIYSSDPNSTNSSSSANINAPELYRFDGKWYIYFGADKTGANGQRRIYVIENTADDPFQGEWVMKGKIADANEDFFASDATILEYNNQRYLVWSGWQQENPVSSTVVLQNIYIAKMLNPWTLDGKRELIAKPANTWEVYQYASAGNNITEAVNLNPQVITNTAGQVFITFTANSCLSPNTSIGLLSLKAGSDPMITANWKKSSSPLFTTNDIDAFSPGFNSFFKSPNGAEDWMAYDASIALGNTCGSARSMRIQKISWNTDGTPNLGSPLLLADSVTRPARN